MTIAKPIKYSVLELAIVGEERTIKETLESSQLLAQKAEEYGYTRFWLAEHHNAKSIASSATPILINYIAQSTHSIRVGSGGIMLPNHSPLIVAEEFGTLGTLYPDRIDLGLGRAPGTDQETADAIRSDRMKATYEFPAEIEKIQQYFSASNAHSKVRAHIAEGVDVPLYILGSSTDSAYLAAAKGLPYAFASHFATAHLFDALRIYHQKFQASEVLQSPYAMVAVNVIIAETMEEAQRMSTSFIRAIYGILTGQREYLQKPTEMTEDLQEFLKHPAVQQMVKYSFIGTKESVKNQTIEFLEKTQADELIVVTNVYDPKARIQSYKIFAEIMQEINEALK